VLKEINMKYGEFTPGGLEVIYEVAVAAHLPIGQENVEGKKIGPGYEIRDDEEAARVTAAAAAATHPLTLKKAAHCIDARPFLSVGGVTDPSVLRELVASQLPGGTYLAVAKAAAAANIVAVRDAKSFEEVFDIVGGILSRAGYQDTYHEECGADNNAASDKQVGSDTALAIFRAAGWVKPGQEAMVTQLHDHKKARLEAGFYQGWDPAAHAKRVRENFPQHYAILQSGTDLTHNHHERGAYDIEEENVGFAKNEFVERTGDQLFAYTRAFAAELADVIGGSDDEREMLRMAFDYDLLDVGNVLFARPEGESGNPDYYPGMAFLK
jgi:hypothetical protein